MTTRPVPAMPLTCSDVARSLALSALLPVCCWCSEPITRFDETRSMGAGNYAHLDCADDCADWMAKEDEPGTDDGFDDEDIAVQKAEEARERAELDRAEQAEQDFEDEREW